MTRIADGRWMRGYFHGDGDPLAVTYHRRVNGKLRQLTLSPKLLSKVLRKHDSLSVKSDQEPTHAHDPRPSTSNRTPS